VDDGGVDIEGGAEGLHALGLLGIDIGARHMRGWRRKTERYWRDFARFFDGVGSAARVRDARRFAWSLVSLNGRSWEEALEFGLEPLVENRGLPPSRRKMGLPNGPMGHGMLLHWMDARVLTFRHEMQHRSFDFASLLMNEDAEERVFICRISKFASALRKSRDRRVGGRSFQTNGHARIRQVRMSGSCARPLSRINRRPCGLLTLLGEHDRTGHRPWRLSRG